MYRKFWLENAQKDIFDLTSENSFLNDPKGLGFTKTYATVRLGDSERVTSQMFNLLEHDGEILFMGGDNARRYELYFQFMKFLSRPPIQIYYQPPNTLTPYVRSMNFIQLDKGETDLSGILRCHFKIKFLSFWQNSATRNLIVEPDTDSGKHYPLTRPLLYGGAVFNNIQVFNDGTLDAGMIIEINGECKDPQINFFQDGMQYGGVKLNGEFDHVLINSNDENEDLIIERKGLILANPMQYQDLSIGSNIYVTFVKLKAGLTTLTVTFGNTFTGNVKFRWRDTYVSV